MFVQRFASPLGTLIIAASDRSLCAVAFEERFVRPSAAVERETPLLAETKRQLLEYFDGRRRDFDLPLETNGTPFENRAWSALSEIPFGETRTYGAQARAIGAPAATRAVGRANGRNPLCIVLPCHRVIGADGSLTGYAGGTAAKRALLDLESSALRRGF